MLKVMPFRTARRLFVGSCLVLAAEAMALCPCGLAPGWANGWPLLSKHTVFAGFITAMLLLAQVAVAAGLLAFPCAAPEKVVPRDYVGWPAFMASMTVVMLIAIIICSWAYPEIRASIAREWP